ncbi:hypothetical protein WA588_000179 [Blastocystis sp. NMH]
MPPKCTYRRESFSGRFSYHEINGTNGGVIPMIYLKSLYASPYTLVYSHANAEDISQLKSFLSTLSQQASCNVVCYDYPGYGLNTEPLSEANVKTTAVSVVEYLIKVLLVDPKRIILFGHSLGSSVSVFAAVHLAEQLNITIAGVILQSCFLSMYRVVDDFRFTSSHDMYCSCDIIGRLPCPVCLIHGVQDVIVPISHAKRIFLQIPEKHRYLCLFVEGAGHNNIECFCNPTMKYYRFIHGFIEYLSRIAPTGQIHNA